MLAILRTTLSLLDAATRRRLGVAFLLAVVLAVLEVGAIGLLLPFLQVLSEDDAQATSGIVDRLAGLLGADTPDELLVRLGLLIAVAFLVRGGLGAWLSWWQSRFLARAEADLAKRLFVGYLAAPYLEHLDASSAALIRNVNSSTVVVCSGVVQPGLLIAADAVMAVFVAGLLVLVQPMVAALSILTLALVGVGYNAAISRRAARLGDANHRLSSDTYRLLQQGLDGFKEVRVRGKEREIVRTFERDRAAWAEIRGAHNFLAQLPRFYIETVVIVSVLLLSVALTRFQAGADALAVLTLFAAAAFRLMPAVNRILASANAVQLGASAVDEVAADLDRIGARLLPTDGQDGPVVELRDDIRLEHVSFAYPRSAGPVLEDVDVVVARGEFIGIVGPSGSGKSTLVDLLLGLLEPTTGRILVDNEPLERRRRAWQRAVGYVPQTVYLQDDSIRSNIAFGCEPDDIDDEQVTAAVRLAQLDEFVAGLPAGLATTVGERGVRISGGERQRIGIARALYHDPQVLVLDEATSALDSETEARVASIINGLRGRRTVVAIAHRLSTVRACDRLIVLERGRVVAEGPFEELERNSLLFANLVQLGQLVPDRR